MDFGIGSIWKSAQKAKSKSGQMGGQRVVLAWTLSIVFGLLAFGFGKVLAEVWTFEHCFGLLGRQMFKNGLLVFWGGNEVTIVINLNFSILIILSIDITDFNNYICSRNAIVTIVLGRAWPLY